MAKFPTLYKNKQQWDCTVYNRGGYSEIVVSFGQVGGKIQQKSTIIDCGKNLGKSNETTHYEQACAEAESKWKKQKDKLYSELHSEDAEDGGFLSIRPMLAQSYDKHAKKIKFPCYGNVKLDGLRAITSRDTILSRKGKRFEVLGHILEAAKNLIDQAAKIGHDIYLDGELYAHDISFQEIISGVKRDESNDFTGKVEYHIYDIIPVDLKPMTYRERWEVIDSLTFAKPLVKVEAFIVNKDDITEHHAKAIERGYEGIMLRNADGIYTPDKRSYDLQKVKMFDDGEFEIVGYEADKNEHCVFVCKTANGDTFKVKPQGTDEERKQYLEDADSLIGKLS